MFLPVLVANIHTDFNFKIMSSIPPISLGLVRVDSSHFLFVLSTVHTSYLWLIKTAFAKEEALVTDLFPGRIFILDRIKTKNACSQTFCGIHSFIILSHIGDLNGLESEMLQVQSHCMYFG